MTYRLLKTIQSRLSAALLSICLATGASAQSPDKAAATELLPFQNKALSAEARTEDLLKRLTLEEKIKLLGGYTFFTLPIERLGVPSFVMADGPQGVRNYGPGCAFPCGTALASTWDTDLARLYGKQLGQESRAKGVHYLLGPGVNITRVAVSGRNFEYFGEDPYLVSRIAVGYVKGVQSEGVIATVKHFAGNNQEWQRQFVDVKIDERALHEIYFPAFKSSIQEGGALAIMSAYNRLNGDYCTDSAFLQKEVLRNQWGFKGMVMSDWDACRSVTAVANGLDLEMPSGKFLTESAVKGALAAGQVKEADIDGAVRHKFFAEFSIGFFDRPQKLDTLTPCSPESAKAALEIARAGVVLLKNENKTLPLDASKIRSIAVYGKYAVDTPVSGLGSGNVSSLRQVDYLDGIRAVAGENIKVTFVEDPKADPAVFESFACARVSADGEPGLKLTVEYLPYKAKIKPLETTVTSINLSWDDQTRPFGLPVGKEAKLKWTGVLVAPEDGDWEIVYESKINGRPEGKPSIGIKPLPPAFKGREFVRWETGDGVRLVKGQPVPITIGWPINARGSQSLKVSLRPIPKYDTTAAKQADVAIVCTGRRAGENLDSFFELPIAQHHLVHAVAAANPRTIVVNSSGAGVDLSEVEKSAPALVQAWVLGQEAGTALAEILFGKVNPSGRLPMTFDRDLFDNTAMKNYPGRPQGAKQPPVVEYKEGIFVGYRSYEQSGKTPLYPFGYGLSYTTFQFDQLDVRPEGDGAKVTLNVTNTGDREGAEVVQIYVGQPKAPVERPVRELKGFAKVSLKPGETRKVTVDLPRDAFAYWSPAKKDWNVDAGEFVIEAGASSRDIKLKQSVQIGR